MVFLKRYWLEIAIAVAALWYISRSKAFTPFSPPNSTAIIGHPGSTNPEG